MKCIQPIKTECVKNDDPWFPVFLEPEIIIKKKPRGYQTSRNKSGIITSMSTTNIKKNSSKHKIFCVNEYN